jgi:dephospho-CoA kinase
MSQPPLLVVVTGMPAAGKTTLARARARRDSSCR